MCHIWILGIDSLLMFIARTHLDSLSSTSIIAFTLWHMSISHSLFLELTCWGEFEIIRFYFEEIMLRLSFTQSSLEPLDSTMMNLSTNWGCIWQVSYMSIMTKGPSLTFRGMIITPLKITFVVVAAPHLFQHLLQSLT